MDKVKVAGVRRYLSAVYLAIVIVMGVLFVPVKAVWGSDNLIDSMDYVPIWSMERANHTINGFIVRYELCLERIIYELAILTLIFIVIYIICKDSLFIKKAERNNAG